MAPYANQVAAARVDNGGPVRVTLGLGTGQDQEEFRPSEQDIVTDNEDTALVNTLKELRQAPEVDFMDVDDLPWAYRDVSEETGGASIVVVDTNILLHFLPLLRATINLLSDLPHDPSMPAPIFSVAQIVFRELDGLKTSNRMTQSHALVPSVDGITASPARQRIAQSSLGSLARAATNWLLDVLPAPGHQGVTFVRGQRHHESLLPLENGRRNAYNGDVLVLDLCQYYIKNLPPGSRVSLLSNDRNLCVQARVEQIYAMTVDEDCTPWQLLERIDPTFANRYKDARVSIPAGPTTPRSSAARRSSSASSPATTKKTTTAKPIPLTLEPDVMELDPEGVPVPRRPTEPPILRPVRSSADVFRNLCDVFAHFLSFLVYDHVARHFEDGKGPRGVCWQDELGDFRTWSADDVVRVVRRFWIDGGLRDICIAALVVHDQSRSEPQPSIPSSPPPPLASPPPPPALAHPTRQTQSSRWSSPSASIPAPNPRRSSPRRSLQPTPSHRPPRDPPERRVARLHASLPNLGVNVSAPISEISSWSVPRFEVMLESLGEALEIFLAGLTRLDVADEVRRVLRESAEQLRAVGVPVSLDPWS